MNNKKNIIFLSMHFPSDITPEAGQKLAYKRLVEMSKNSNIHLIAVVNEKEFPLYKKENYNFCLSVNVLKINNIRRVLNVCRNPLLPLVVGVRNDNRVVSLVNKIINKYNPHEIHIEYEQGAVFLEKISFPQSTVVFHDVISQSLERFSKYETNILKCLFFKAQYHLALSWEKRILNLISNCIVLNLKDKMLIENINSSVNKVSVDYPTVSLIFYNARRDRREKYNLLFWGAMNRPENIDAVLWFKEKIFPNVLKEKPNAVLTVVGANPNDSIKSIACHNIIVTGFVDNPIPFFEKATLAIVPLRFGAGIKIKVIESLAAGLNVVSTDVGAEGVDNSSGLLHVVNGEDEFSKKILELLK